MEEQKVIIIWNGVGGELDRTEVVEDDGDAVTKAFIKMLQGNIVSPGDSFTVEYL